MIQSFNKIEKVKGELILPGDKSVSHRAVMFSSLAKGKSVIYNLLESEDIYATINAFRCMGCEIEKRRDHFVVVGSGFKNLTKPFRPLDMGNSGTTTRLISGILAAQNFETKLIGDESLSKRPMRRIADPLNLMGASIETSDTGTLPVIIRPTRELKAIEYKLPVASAQIKSAVLLTGLHLEDKTTVIETLPSRSHTENMLDLKVEETADGRKIYVSKDDYPGLQEYSVPSDISTAAFFIVHTLLTKNSEVKIKNVLLNETRTGLLTVLREMGGDIEIDNPVKINNELRSDIIVCSSKLKNIEIKKEIIPNIIDEIPILTIAGLFAEGDFIINNAKELRAKESDRIASVCTNLKLLGLDIEEYDDGYKVSGSVNNTKVTFESYHDHRIAMAFSILSLLLEQGGNVDGFETVNISNPNFLEQVKSITI
ncbi:MAG: 3-phosphoshikimate 1-carboxyvinyltransferase [Ignavibacteria bacterium]